VGPATLGGSGWVDALAQSSVADFVANLAPSSAGSALVRAGLGLDLTGRAEVIVPGVAVSAGGLAFTDEGDALPAVAFDAGGSATLRPFKLGGIVVLTREAATSRNVEVIVRAQLTESAALALDAVLLGSAGATGSAPAGLLNGSTVVTPSPDLIEDLAALAGAVAAVGGGTLVFVADPAAYAKVRLRCPNFAWPLYPTAALPPNTIAAFAANALAFGVEATPSIVATEEASIVMEAPAAQVVAAGVTAAPVRSAFQSGTVAVRVILDCGWGLRTAPSAAAAVFTGSQW
jgi:hypothetical protein